jgi:hypothetical protein
MSLLSGAPAPRKGMPAAKLDAAEHSGRLVPSRLALFRSGL